MEGEALPPLPPSAPVLAMALARAVPTAAGMRRSSNRYTLRPSCCHDATAKRQSAIMAQACGLRMDFDNAQHACNNAEATKCPVKELCKLMQCQPANAMHAQMSCCCHSEIGCD